MDQSTNLAKAHQGKRTTKIPVVGASEKVLKHFTPTGLALGRLWTVLEFKSNYSDSAQISTGLQAWPKIEGSRVKLVGSPERRAEQVGGKKKNPQGNRQTITRRMRARYSTQGREKKANTFLYARTTLEPEDEIDKKLSNLHRNFST